MSVSIGVIIILLVYTGIAVLDQISIQIGPYSALFGGAFTGLVMGDLATGLLIGATLQLATLGVATYGGATVPDFLSGSIIGTTYAILSDGGVEYGMGIAIPVGLLLIQLDILGRMCNTFFQHRADRYAETGNYKGVERCNVAGILPWTLSRIIPVFICLVFGEQVIGLINEFIPAWFMTGLQAAGKILPAMGIAILMRYLPLKKFYPFFIIGFVLMAYFSESMTVLGVALLGFAAAALYVMAKQSRKGTVSSSSAGNTDDDEEVEIDG